MSQFIESLKRLYHNGKISLEKLHQLVTECKISQDEFDYITQ